MKKILYKHSKEKKQTNPISSALCRWWSNPTALLSLLWTVRPSFWGLVLSSKLLKEDDDRRGDTLPFPCHDRKPTPREEHSLASKSIASSSRWIARTWYSSALLRLDRTEDENWEAEEWHLEQIDLCIGWCEEEEMDDMEERWEEEEE